jgi:hypothetical protein
MKKFVIKFSLSNFETGLIPFSDVIAVAGTGRGADTAAVIKANSSNRLFDIKVREYQIKPYEF